MRSKSLISIILILNLLLACGGEKTLQKPESQGGLPDWVNNPHKKHPKSVYLVAVGVSDSKFEAESKAYEGISRVFGVDVNSTETITTNVSEEGVGADSKLSKSAKLVNQMTMKTGQKVLNTNIENIYLDQTSGKYYVLATLHKAQTSEVYIKQINENKIQIDKWLDLYSTENDNLVKLSYLTKTKTLIDLTNLLKQPLKVLDYFDTEVDLTETEKTVERNRQMLLKETKVYIAGSGEIPQSVKDAMAKSITNTGMQLSASENEASLIVDVKFSHKEVNIGQKKGTHFALWDFSADVKRTKTNSSFGVFTKTARTGQMNYDAAVKRSVYNLNKHIDKKFGSFFTQKVFN